MKKLFIFFMLSLIIQTSCNNKNELEQKSFNMNSKISVYPYKKISPRSTNENTMTYEDSIKAIFNIEPFYLRWRGISEDDNHWFEKAIEDVNIDTINYKFIWLGRDVILMTSLVTNELELGYMVTLYKDIVLVDARKIYTDRSLVDTIGYIPNYIIMEARKKIVEAFNRQDYEECYRLFDSAYKFRLINGEGYRKLQEQGLN